MREYRNNCLLKLKAKLLFLLITIFYFGLLLITVLHSIRMNYLMEGIVRLVIVVTAFAFGSYIMFHYSIWKRHKRHVPNSNELQEFETTKWHMISDKIIAILFLLVGVILMTINLL